MKKVLVVVENPNVFTTHPDATANMLFEAVRRLGGSLELTVEELNENALEAGEAGVDETPTMIREDLEFCEHGSVSRFRLRIVPMKEAREIAEANINKEIAESIKRDSGGSIGATDFIEKIKREMGGE